jgi:hypothetical protein
VRTKPAPLPITAQWVVECVNCSAYARHIHAFSSAYARDKWVTDHSFGVQHNWFNVRTVDLIWSSGHAR